MNALKVNYIKLAFYYFTRHFKQLLRLAIMNVNLYFIDKKLFLVSLNTMKNYIQFQFKLSSCHFDV